MKLGPWVALVTTLLMTAVLAFSTWAVLLNRRADLERDLERQAMDVATAVAAGLEPLKPSEPLQVLRERISWAASAGTPFTLEALASGGERAESFSSWAALVEAATSAHAPTGRLFGATQTRPIYAMVAPLHNGLPGDPTRQAVAFLGLKRDCSYIDAEVSSTARHVAPFFIAGILLFGGVVYFLVLGTVATPLRRLVEAIDAVSKGDLSRAILPQRNDEIGSLAARFNAMTTYLREAKQEEARANTTRLALETRLRHSEKLATMGQMAAEIAHEVGTPLHVIGGRARSLAKRPADVPDVQKNAEIIGTQVERIAKIIRQVLDFSRQSRPSLTQVDVAKVAAEAVEFLEEPLRRQNVSVTVSASGELPNIPGDPGEIQQVCLNMMTNAISAMPGGGELTLHIECVSRRKEGLALSPPGRFLVLEFRDTGKGIPVADREKIFEAFFTTKDTGEGTGLGLAVSKGIVKDHDGWIEVDSPPGGGAAFKVFLPVSGDAGASLAEEAAISKDQPG